MAIIWAVNNKLNFIPMMFIAGHYAGWHQQSDYFTYYVCAHRINPLIFCRNSVFFLMRLNSSTTSVPATDLHTPTSAVSNVYDVCMSASTAQNYLSRCSRCCVSLSLLRPSHSLLWARVRVRLCLCSFFSFTFPTVYASWLACIRFPFQFIQYQWNQETII